MTTPPFPSHPDPERSTDSASKYEFLSRGQEATNVSPNDIRLDESLTAFQKVLPQRYQLLGEIGRGGMAQVLLAIDRGPVLNGNATVAIKRLWGAMTQDASTIDGFLKELEHARELRHPHVVKMFHCDQTSLGPYIVMEYIQGMNLLEYIQKHGALGEELAIQWFRPLAAALDEAHGRKIIHRDVKPSNILIDSEGKAYLADFGISRRLDPADHTGSGFGAGTLSYMSPQQLENHAPDALQDIYSFGATLFHALTGSPPFTAPTIPALIAKIMTEEVSTISGITKVLSEQIERSLNKRSENRPLSCGAIFESIPVRSNVQVPSSPATSSSPTVTTSDCDRESITKVKSIPPENLSQSSSGSSRKVAVVLLAAIALPIMLFILWNHDSSRKDVASAPLAAPRPTTEALDPKPENNSLPAEVPSQKPQERLSEGEYHDNPLISMRMKRIPQGTFTMGSTAAEHAALKLWDPSFELNLSAELPPHEVTIRHDFYLGMHEVTRGQFSKFVAATGYVTECEKDGRGGWGVGSDGQFVQAKEFDWRKTGFEQADSHPVVNVSWNDCQAFAKWLTEQSRELGYIRQEQSYRLPTEAEWEYAARGGEYGWYSFGDNPEELVQYGNVADKSFNRVQESSYRTVIGDDQSAYTSTVGRYRANAFGLFDMHGNVWEWCSDWYGEYPIDAVTDWQGPDQGVERVHRGGGWHDGAIACRSAYRLWTSPQDRHRDLGFRLALSPSN
jgi:formylglycine-generating enzyme required for sulfatase activity